jgi:hypothetical protein
VEVLRGIASWIVTLDSKNLYNQWEETKEILATENKLEEEVYEFQKFP